MDCNPQKDRRQGKMGHGVASVSRIDKMIGLFCKRALSKKRYSGKETYDLINPTDRSHPIVVYTLQHTLTATHCTATHSGLQQQRRLR